MNPRRNVEAQCTHAEFMSSLPKACGGLPYEIIDNQVIVHDKGRQVRITVHDEPIKHLESLNLPMEKIEFVFDKFSEEQADEFMCAYRKNLLRSGGS